MSLFDFSSKKDNKELSIIQDPFSKKCVERVYINIQKSMFAPYEPRCTASVEFKNGNTKGSQDFGPEESYEVLMSKVNAFLNTLQ